MALEKAVDKVITEQKRGGDSQVSVPICRQYQLHTDSTKQLTAVLSMSGTDTWDIGFLHNINPYHH